MTDPATAPEPTPAAEAGAEQITVAASELEALRVAVVEWKERCSRQQAEFENVRKRLRREADEAGTRAVARTIKPLLDQLDNLDRALDAARPDAFAEFAQGVTMIREQFRAALAGQGLVPVPCEGRFDPAVHEVIAEAETAEQPKGHIIQVHRAGWKLGEQLVRAAQVVVAKPLSG